MKDIRIAEIRSFLLDLDGTLYLGKNWIPGAREFLARVTETGRQYCFLSNNSSRTTEEYVEKFRAMGMEIDPASQLIVSFHAMIDYLKLHFAGQSVYLLGREALKREFEADGIRIEEEHPDLVVTAFDTELTYAKLTKVCDLVRSGLPYLATHPDFNCPTADGFIPDLGSFAALIEASAGRKPDLVIGKPNRYIIDYARKVTGASAEETAVVGDRIYTDIASGYNAGAASILVLSGEANMEDVRNSVIKPDRIVHSVADLITEL